MLKIPFVDLKERYQSEIMYIYSHKKARFFEKGVLWSVSTLFKKICILSLWFFLLPLTLLLHLIGFRRLTIQVDRIGHLAGETDTFLKSLLLGEIPKKKYFIITSKKVANKKLLEYIRAYLLVIDSKFLSHLLSIMSSFFLMRHNVKKIMLTLKAADIYRINRVWGDKPPIFKISKAHEDECHNLINKLGLKDRWFVCIHAREKGYSPEDDHVHEYRNSNINYLIPAIKAIIKAGGLCVRMGHTKMTKFPKIDGLIEYLHSEYQSPSMDIYLAAKCRFFLGDSSGFFIVASIFGVKSVLVNMAPFNACAFKFGDIGIPKLLRDMTTGKLIPISKIFKMGYGELRHTDLFHEKKIEVIENSAEDILDLVNQALQNNITNENVDKTVDQRWHFYTSHFSSRTYCNNTVSRFGSSFIKKYEILFT